MRRKSYKGDIGLLRLHNMSRDIRVLGIGSIERCFLGIMGILRFCDFVIL